MSTICVYAHTCTSVGGYLEFEVIPCYVRTRMVPVATSDLSAADLLSDAAKSEQSGGRNSGCPHWKKEHDNGGCWCCCDGKTSVQPKQARAPGFFVYVGRCRRRRQYHLLSEEDVTWRKERRPYYGCWPPFGDSASPSRAACWLRPSTAQNAASRSTEAGMAGRCCNVRRCRIAPTKQSASR